MLLWLLTLAFSAGDSISRSGNLPDALPVLMAEAEAGGSDPWLLYRLAWTANRMERPDIALAPSLAAWTMDPSNQWYLAEYLRALRDLGMLNEMMEFAVFVRGGGVCRYYLAACERELGLDHATSFLYLSETSVARDDSAAADASLWLALLHRGPAGSDSALVLARRAVELAPDDDFYRCVLAEQLAEAEDVEGSREQMHHLRLSGDQGYSYWTAMAVLAEAEGDPDRRIWALRRARALRICPRSGRDLGWALYFRGRDLLREGDTIASRELLRESSQMGDTSEAFVQRADSLLGLLDEFENRSAGSD